MIIGLSIKGFNILVSTIAINIINKVLIKGFARSNIVDF